MTIVLDIDHTLVNAEKLKRALARDARACGITPRRFWEAYRVVRKSGAFSPEAVAAQLGSDVAMRRRLCVRWWATLNSAQKFFYADVPAFLRWARDVRHAIVFYTYGNPRVQRAKVRALRAFAPRARAVITADAAKRDDLRSVLPHGERWVWVDDADVRLHAALPPNGTIIRIARGRGGRGIVGSLAGARKFIESLSR